MTYKIVVEADTYDECVKLWELLRPVADSDGWIKWDAEDIRGPVNFDQVVETRFRDGQKDGPRKAGHYRWNKGDNFDSGFDIVAYRVVK